jgi:Zn-finger nucleic acid-binding protein
VPHLILDVRSLAKVKACPRDGGPLRLHKGQAAPAERCESCSGIWLAGLVVARHVGQVPRAAQIKRAGRQTALRCPTDGAQLTEVHHHGVEIDVCPQCAGVWLDHGELERIVGARRRATAGRVLDEVVSNDYFLDAAGDITGEALSSLLEFVVELFSNW